jgi:hypothetical protein
MDKNKFWLGGRLFNTTSPRLGAPKQRKARPQVGRNSRPQRHASWVPNSRPQRKRKARLHVRKLGAPMQRKARPLGGRLFNTASPSLGTPTQRNARPQDGRPNASQGTSASWAPQRNARHIRKLGAPTHVRNANARHVRTSASWVPQMQGTSARPHVRKLSSQDGRPNEKLIRNENVHPREH